jgi:hypothetical protein
VNCVVSACDFVNCGFIYHCHVRWIELYVSSHVLRFDVFIVFEDIVLMDSDRYRCIFRLTTIIFEITRISTPYSFMIISYRFRFKKNDLASYPSFPIVFIPICDPRSSATHRNHRIAIISIPGRRLLASTAFLFASSWERTYVHPCCRLY